MTPLLTIVVFMALVTWATIIAASAFRFKEWTIGGIKLAMGNREDTPDASAFAGRAERTARNTMENFALFVPLALVAHAAGIQSPNLLLGAQIFFYSRLLYIPIYYIGIPYLRSAVFGVSIGGLAMMVVAML